MTVERKYERDIDLLLAEEFAVSPSFATWFLGQTRFRDLDGSVLDVYVSRADATGESDLVVVYETLAGDQRVALLIEDKIDAPLQPDQAKRYRLRAENEVRRGDYQAWETVLCSPAGYAAAHPEASGFDRHVTYEAIAEFLRSSDAGPRALYRANFIASVAQRNANTWTRVDDAATNAFWDAAHAIAREQFLSLELKPLRLTKDSSWITVRPQIMPTQPVWTYISLKADRGFADLTFTGVPASSFTEASPAPLGTGMTVHQTGKSAAIRLRFDGFLPSEPLATALPKVRNAFAASAALVGFYADNKEALDRWALKFATSRLSA